jgi:ATP-binding cassette subfamily C protein LapB
MDTATEKTVLDRLRDWSENKTMIMITHRNTILELADRVIVLDKGKILADTTPEKIKAGR